MLRVAQGWCHDKVSRPVIALLYVAVLRLVIRCSSWRAHTLWLSCLSASWLAWKSRGYALCYSRGEVIHMCVGRRECSTSKRHQFTYVRGRVFLHEPILYSTTIFQYQYFNTIRMYIHVIGRPSMYGQIVQLRTKLHECSSHDL